MLILISMKSNSKFTLQKFTNFSSSMLHQAFPDIDILQLESGPIKGWVLSARIGPYHLNASSFDRAFLLEGTFNSNMLHVGFILSQEHSAIALAHEYNSGTIDINYGATYTREVYPANMVWGNIYAPEKIMMDGIQYSKKMLKTHSHLIINGSRDELLPLIKTVNDCIGHSTETKRKKNCCQARILKTALHNLIDSRLTETAYDQQFITGDKYRMQIINNIIKLSLENNNQPLSLDEICTEVKMKPRTVQKYFHEIYGMGPTQYFRIRRLNGARNDLMNGATSVSETALHWGFTHFGNFAANYKKLFYETPKITRDRTSPQDS